MDNFVTIKTEFIKLQQAMKLAGVVDQGSDAKLIIQDGVVMVNDEVCTMRGKKLYAGDIVRVNGEVIGRNEDVVFTIRDEIK